MSQPFDRKCNVPAAGALDKESGQFWVGNAWEIIDHDHNLSAYERKAAYLNVGSKPGEARFVNFSFLSGADGDGDGRTAVAADLDGDGMQDLVMRQAGGGPLVVYRNDLPKRHWLRVRLKGTVSNGQGIGAKLTVEIGGRKLFRELYPQNTYVSQQPTEGHFGLGDATKVDRLVIRWPSGRTQEIRDLTVDRLLTVTESRE
ncbi:MAG TPA: ASPIC/UnbV domain-containing protein [Planctomycetia bacterium]|nr:ASPIC/UnbV domain-containing protein [Planctomycetia bacterium]